MVSAFLLQPTIFAELIPDLDEHQMLVLWVSVLGGVTLLLIAGLALRIWRRRRATRNLPEPELFIDVSTLELGAMPEAGPRAEI